MVLQKYQVRQVKQEHLNFFNVNDALYFVDVPGYGYAKVANNVTKQFGKTMDEYISERQTLRGFILLGRLSS